MAAVKVQKAVSIPGFTSPLKHTDLQVTNKLYNKLYSVEAQSEVSAKHLQTLAQMFVRHGVHETLGVHLVHRHLNLEADVVMVGTNVAGLSACWNKPTKMADVDLINIHGPIFKLVDDEHFVAYEFEEGVVNNLSSCSADFFAEFALF